MRAIKSLIENNILSYKYIAVIEKLSPLLKQNQESFVSSILKIEDLDELNIFYLILREKQNRKKSIYIGELAVLSKIASLSEEIDYKNLRKCYSFCLI